MLKVCIKIQLALDPTGDFRHSDPLQCPFQNSWIRHCEWQRFPPIAGFKGADSAHGFARCPLPFSVEICIISPCIAQQSKRASFSSFGRLHQSSLELISTEMVGVITEIDDKLNKRHITVKKLYRKRTETEQNLKKNYDPTRPWD